MLATIHNSVQNIFSYRFLSKDKYPRQRELFSFTLFYECQTWSLKLREVHRRGGETSDSHSDENKDDNIMVYEAV
jgi:hypothetical protein